MEPFTPREGARPVSPHPWKDVRSRESRATLQARRTEWEGSHKGDILLKIRKISLTLPRRPKGLQIKGKHIIL